ncbi:MAG TPA: hypothetical protein VKY92_11060 [Verrucomicrobiae bacterium]|nr:hypothetical protein [Verrucomicrobiae bacterium]
MNLFSFAITRNAVELSKKTSRLAPGLFHMALLVATMGLLPALEAKAQVISHFAAGAPPTAQGFGIWPYNGGIVTNALTNDQGLAAFQIQNTGNNAEQAYYEMVGGTGPFSSQGSGLTALQASQISTQGFTLSLTARVAQGPPLGTNGFFSLNATVAGFSSFRYDIDLGTDGNSNTTVVLPTLTKYVSGQFFGTSTNLPLVLTGAVYHLYQLSYDPKSAAATLYIDGLVRQSGYTGSGVTGGATANNFGLAFGAVNDATGNFADVKLAIGQIAVAGQRALLSTPKLTSGDFSFTVSGPSGLGYIIQRSTNLASTNWLSIFTNTLPFKVSDTNISAPDRFYRAVPQ